jgi:hypothetical protein
MQEYDGSESFPICGIPIGSGKTCNATSEITNERKERGKSAAVIASSYCDNANY